MAETHHTFCRICEALCGLEVTVEDGEVTRIRPDDAHVATDGFACFKGIKQHKLYSSPDRVRHPMKRVGDDWRRVSWDQALAEIGEKVRRLSGSDGPDSVGLYVGTAAGFGVLHPVFALGYMQGIGTTSMYSSATQDCANKFAAARELYGFALTQPFPDIERTNCLVIVGANPVVSKWSFLQVPNPMKRLREIEDRGGRVFVVDPRRTETAKAAGTHAFIKPNTDIFFYLAFLHELVETGGVDHARILRHTTGWGEIARLVERWTPERAETVTRMPAATLREIVAAYRAADGAALYSSTGVNMGTHGTLCFWLQEVINTVSGNLDRPGGTVVGKGVIDFAKFGIRTGTMTSDARSRIGGYRQVNDAYPGGILADEILTPGDRQLKALFVTGGNPLLTMADAGRLREALSKLELLVCLDIYRNETASLAHYVLPTTSPLERPDLPFVFPLMLGMQRKPYLQATRRVVRPDGEQRDEATIYLDLCRASGVDLFGSKIAQKSLEAMKAAYSRRHPDEQPALPQEAILSTLLRLTRNGSFKKLLAESHGRLRPGHAPGDFLTDRIVTPDKKVRLAPEAFVDEARQLESDYEREVEAGRGLRLITRRHTKTHNSWTHNHEEFVAGDFTTNHLYMHPDDAAERGLGDGDVVDVTSATATVRVPVRCLEDLMPGTVALPHGWGHQHATGLSVASETTGVNVNLLAASGPDSVESVSGMSQLTGLPVQVERAPGPQDGTSWSGLPARTAVSAGPEPSI